MKFSKHSGGFWSVTDVLDFFLVFIWFHVKNVFLVDSVNMLNDSVETFMKIFSLNYKFFRIILKIQYLKRILQLYFKTFTLIQTNHWRNTND